MSRFISHLIEYTIDQESIALWRASVIQTLRERGFEVPDVEADDQRFIPYWILVRTDELLEAARLLRIPTKNGAIPLVTNRTNELTRSMIIRDRQAGDSLRAVAARYGVSAQTVTNIVTKHETQAAPKKLGRPVGSKNQKKPPPALNISVTLIEYYKQDLARQSTALDRRNTRKLWYVSVCATIIERGPTCEVILPRRRRRKSDVETVRFLPFWRSTEEAELEELWKYLRPYFGHPSMRNEILT